MLINLSNVILKKRHINIFVNCLPKMNDGEYWKKINFYILVLTSVIDTKTIIIKVKYY